eukprot:SAG31_NODE_5663_length_2396_cov_8.465331_1_plen_183_part_00
MARQRKWKRDAWQKVEDSPGLLTHLLEHLFTGYDGAEKLPKWSRTVHQRHSAAFFRVSAVCRLWRQAASDLMLMVCMPFYKQHRPAVQMLSFIYFEHSPAVLLSEQDESRLRAILDSHYPLAACLRGMYCCSTSSFKLMAQIDALVRRANQSGRVSFGLMQSGSVIDVCLKLASVFPLSVEL